MHILLVAATRAEIAPLLEHLGGNWQRPSDDVFTRDGHYIRLLVTGVGMVATAYKLTKALQAGPFDLALQAGVAGSFNRNIPLGEVVYVASEVFGDLGAEDHYNFLDLYELGLEDPQAWPFSAGRLLAPEALPGMDSLREVSALSVNAVSGSSFTATARYEKFSCDIESMEGAAFFLVCRCENQSFAQIRSISNYVEARDKSGWQMKEAVISLNRWLAAFTDSL